MYCGAGGFAVKQLLFKNERTEYVEVRRKTDT